MSSRCSCRVGKQDRGALRLPADAAATNRSSGHTSRALHTRRIHYRGPMGHKSVSRRTPRTMCRPEAGSFDDRAPVEEHDGFRHKAAVGNADRWWPSSQYPEGIRAFLHIRRPAWTRELGWPAIFKNVENSILRGGARRSRRPPGVGPASGGPGLNAGPSAHRSAPVSPRESDREARRAAGTALTASRRP